MRALRPQRTRNARDAEYCRKMRRNKFLILLFAFVLAVAGCSSGSGDTAVADTTSDSASTSSNSDTTASSSGETTDTTDSGTTSDETESTVAVDTAEPAAAGAALQLLFSVPANGSGFGSAVAFSPDGSEVAVLNAGFEATVEIYDVASGSLSRSGSWHGQGVAFFWSNDNRLVSYRPDRTYALDASSLATLEPVVATLDATADRCPDIPFDVRFDLASNAMFVAETAGPDAIVCRIDLNTASTTSLVLTGGAVPLSQLRPNGSQLLVEYKVGDALGESLLATIDPATLALISTESLPPGALKAATNDDIVTPVDRFTDQLAGAGTVLPTQALGNAGPYIAGSIDGQLALMDASGNLVAQGADWIQPRAVSPDGAKVAVLLADSLDVFTVG